MRKNYFHLVAKMAIVAIICSFSLSTTAQTLIGTPSDFITKINADLAGNYKLTADLDFANVNFKCFETFTGTLDGDGYALKNISINNDTRFTGIFKRIDGGATIKNLIIDGAKVIGLNQTGGLVGEVRGGSTIERCAMLNSLVIGYDHKGVFVGNLGGGSAIRDCYTTSILVQTEENWGGGIVGLIDRSGQNTVERCYNSGDILNNTNGSGGIVGRAESNSGAIPTIRDNVNLARVISAWWEHKHRVVGVKESEVVLEDNFSLSSTKIRDLNSNTEYTIDATNAEYGTDRLEGANIPSGDNNAQRADFYRITLGWNFNTVWEIDANNAYPTLRMQKTKPLSLQNHQGLTLREGETLDLSRIFSTSGINVPLTFATTSSLVTISGNTLSINGTLTQQERVTVTASGGSFAPTSFEVILYKDNIELSAPKDLTLITLNPNSNFILKNNIDMTGVPFTALCITNFPFRGILDGNGKIITGLKHDEGGTNHVGLIRKGSHCQINNLGIENARFVGNDNVGGIVGNADNVSVSQSYVKNSYIEANDRAGSIIGQMEHGTTINNCYGSSNEMKARYHQVGGLGGATVYGGGNVYNSYFFGTTTTAGGFNGGIVGLLDQDATINIKRTVNLATAMTAENADKKARITNTSGRGSLADNYSLLISGTNEGTATDGNGATLTAEQSKDQAFYTGIGWDFTNVWGFKSGEDYPVLRVFGGITTGTQAAEKVAAIIRVSDNKLIVTELNDATVVSVFSVEGKLLVRKQASSDFTYQLPSKGIYVVDIQSGKAKSSTKIVN